MKEAFAELSSVEESVGTFNSLEMVYMLAKQDLTKEHIKAMINESGLPPRLSSRASTHGPLQVHVQDAS